MSIELYLKKQSRKATIQGHDHLKNDLGLDSMQLLELIVFVNENFGIDLGQKALEGRPVNTVQDILALVE